MVVLPRELARKAPKSRRRGNVSRRRPPPRRPRRRTKSSPPTTTSRGLRLSTIDEELNALFNEAADKAMDAIVEKFFDVDYMVEV